MWYPNLKKKSSESIQAEKLGMEQSKARQEGSDF
jgi:hypothetical protein